MEKSACSAQLMLTQRHALSSLYPLNKSQQYRIVLMNLLPISHRQQSQQADCLAACTAMILEHLHVPVQYENLLRLLNVRSFGASLFNLRNLQKLGLFVVIKEGHFSDLQSYLDMGLPVVVSVSTAELRSYWGGVPNVV
jgi:hypothetical protein